MILQTNEERTEVEQEGEKGKSAIPAELPILPLRQTVVYPLTFLPLNIERPESIKLIDDVVLGDRMVGLVTVKNVDADRASPEDLYSVGTAAVVHRAIKSPTGSVAVIVQGIERIKPTEFIQTEPYLEARIEVIPDDGEQESLEVEALSRNTMDLFQRMVSLVSYLPNELMMAVLNTEAPRQLLYLVANAVRMDTEAAQQLLEIDSVKDKLHRLNAILSRELEVLELGQKIRDEAQSDMEKTQREYFLRQQLKAIQKELGEEDEQGKEVNELREKIETAGMSEEAKKEALRELDRLSSMPQAAAEYSVIRTYLGWLIELPWQVSTEDNLDINRAREILDEDHYDLEEIKERILEYLAVRKLRLEREEGEGAKESKGAILNFVGPPGTGKTSLGRSIARALGREFIRMSLGGMRDEAEIRGHRRTYVGALPGRIIQSIKRAGSKNPVFMLDEVDKIGSDFRGDPSSALLEVLDPEQNFSFRDHYLDVDWDLSPVMFITTGNVLYTIPPPLLDRMETIELDGYTEEEKVKIAQRYLIPRQIEENSLKEGEVEFKEDALRLIIGEYTREAGLRNLEREIGSVCRKVATRIAAGEEGTVVVTKENVSDFLGKPKFYNEAAERTEVPGVATGLVVTSTGGDITFIEATKMQGSKGLTLTGKLGDVMKESAQAALSYVRSRAKELNIDEGFFDETDLHIHFPAGAIPKDGPSAGVSIATALVSLLTDTPVKCDVGMTGEITLRGRVLPIGGVKQKILAAARVGLKTVILPRHNEKHLDELPEEVRNGLDFVLVDTMDEVLEAALGDGFVKDEC
ncbi:MAG: endopeptidase La [Chloroflexi bacterium B3_Chlor]|nr:MAG: endopeptidase La [Chloroflexi bacterium B3_Chlor]